MFNRFYLSVVKRACPWAMAFFVFFSAFEAQALTVDFTLDDILTSTRSGNPITGTFTWTYDEGTFEDGDGVFTELSIPGTSRSIDEFQISFDVKKNIEISLLANLSNVDIEIVIAFFGPLSLTQPVLVDVDNSSFLVFDNGRTGGLISGGSISPVLSVSAVPVPAALPLFGTGLAVMGFIGWRRKRRAEIFHLGHSK